MKKLAICSIVLTMQVVLVVPDVLVREGKTARMYRSLKAPNYTDGKVTEKFVEIVKGKGQFKPEMLFNTFENVAFKDNKLQAYKEHLIKLGAHHVHMVGSGPALFIMFEDKKQAEDLYNSCGKQGMKAYMAETL